MTKAIAMLAWETGISPEALLWTADEAPGVFEEMLRIRGDLARQAKKKGR